MKRRSFFQSIAKAAAIIALAPQIAFREPAIAFYTPKPSPVFFDIHAPLVRAYIQCRMKRVMKEGPGYSEIDEEYDNAC